MSEIFKIQKNSNYTAMSNIHLQDKRQIGRMLDDLLQE